MPMFTAFTDLRRKAAILLPWLKGAVLFAVALTLIYVAHTHMPETEELSQGLQRFAALAGAWTAPLFVIGSALLSCLFVPRQVIAFAGGFALGPVWGGVLSTLGVTLGCAVALFFARCIGRTALERRYADKLRSFNDAAIRSPFLMGLAARLFPSGNNLIFSLLAGLSRVAALPFICGSALGYIPQNTVFALLGSGARIAPELRTAAAVLLFLIATVLAFYIYKRIRVGKTNAQQSEHAKKCI